MTLRPLLAMLLLLNYLLVVGAGLAARPTRVIDTPFAYEHRHDCQLRNTLRVACFDDCNGEQYTVQKNGERVPLHQLLTTLKSLDLHCLPVTGFRAVAPVGFEVPELRQTAYVVGAPTGYQGRIELPPRRG